MQLYHLIQSYEFSELMPVVAEMFPGIGRYKKILQKAYQLMIDLTPVESKKNIRFKLLHDAESDTAYMGAEDQYFQTTWEVCLGKSVVREKGVDLTQEELAACCFVNVICLAKPPKSFESLRRELLK